MADFGFSRKVGDDKEGKTYNNVGPIRWMAPECIAYNRYSEKSDVWAFGITAWEILTRKQPHAGANLLDLGIRIRDEGLTPPVPPQAPKQLKALLQRCWEFVFVFAVFSSLSSNSAPSRYEPIERPTFQEIVDQLEADFPTLTETDDGADNTTNSASKSGKKSKSDVKSSTTASESKSKVTSTEDKSKVRGSIVEMEALPPKQEKRKSTKNKVSPVGEYMALSVESQAAACVPYLFSKFCLFCLAACSILLLLSSYLFGFG